MEMKEAIANAIMERPHNFVVGRRRYALYPLTLGKSILLQRLLASLAINEELLAKAPTLEVMRLVASNRDTCLRIVAYMTCEDKDEVFDVDYINTTIRHLSDNLNDEELSTLMMTVLTEPGADEMMKELGITEEYEMMCRVLDVKESEGSLSFGGKSLYGTYIDQLCERYGWTMDYVVWGISYTNGRLLLADKVNQVYLTEDERKKVPQAILAKDKTVIRATKENMEMIRQMDWR